MREAAAAVGVLTLAVVLYDLSLVRRRKATLSAFVWWLSTHRAGRLVLSALCAAAVEHFFLTPARSRYG